MPGRDFAFRRFDGRLIHSRGFMFKMRLSAILAARLSWSALNTGDA